VLMMTNLVRPHAYLARKSAEPRALQEHIRIP